ncbi:leucine-rich repeat-containing protein 74A isoform X2 [Cuculus canorus]|uniref:leucine-rich repeat-containing protein 74A isoform X2 n=1 Tax=Cuculus canorus TaxID=55661 RepID=UPI0023AA95BF|nr:leucine-rich repeat-containing protein 74A isoform X2 [Cuculus canorus]
MGSQSNRVSSTECHPLELEGADQNEDMSNTSESVSLADTSAEKVMQGADADLEEKATQGADTDLGEQAMQAADTDLGEKATQGADTDLEDEGPVKAFAGIMGAELYLEACKLMKVVPVSIFIRNLAKPYINLNHYGLGPKGVKAIAIALVSNAAVTHLELEDNIILAEGAICIAKMLQRNSTLQELNISNNHLDTAGAEAIAGLLLDNVSYLHALQLSGNNFGDKAASYLAEALTGNFKLKELDLSHNEFTEKGGQLLGQMIDINTTLEILDLSWNYLRRKGTVALGRGLRVNGALKILNLSWNGIGNVGALALGEALSVNNVLVHLDISNNQIDNEGAKNLCRGLEVNGKLKILKMANNPLTVEGATALLTSVRKNPNSMMEEINISNVLVNETFIKLLDLVCQTRPELDVIYGEVEGCVAKIPKQHPSPMKVIQNYLKEHNLQLWDFFSNIDKDGSMKIPVAVFRRAMMQSSIPLDRVQIGELVRKLDWNQTGFVDYRHLKEQEPTQKPVEGEVEEEKDKP